MNLVKKQIIILLLNAYKRKFKFLKLRKLIKKLIGNERIISSYQNIKIVAGTQSAIESSILFDEYNEKNILNLIAFFANQNYHFIDVGANVGAHSLTAACANPDIQVYAFEPEPNNFYNLLLNITTNQVQNIKPFRLGVGNTNENLFLNVNDGWNKGRHSLKNKFGANTQQVHISIFALDSLMSCFPNQKVVFKIDVEGFEKEVLEGADVFLQNITEAVIIIELLQENNDTQVCASIVEKIKYYGFSTCYKVTEKNCFQKVDSFEGSADYIFLKGEATLTHFIKNNTQCE